MAKPYSDDLRERVVADIEAGFTREEVAELYNLAPYGHLCNPDCRARLIAIFQGKRKDVDNATSQMERSHP
jgi:hypothetical protein